MNSRSGGILQDVDQLLLDRWERRQELILLTAKQDVRGSPQVHRSKLILRFAAGKDVRRWRRGHFAYLKFDEVIELQNTILTEKLRENSFVCVNPGLDDGPKISACFK